MIAVDTNILVYSHREDSSFHGAALEAVRGLAESTSLWAIPWPVIHEFLAVVTHPRIYSPPTPLDDALLQVRRWMDSPSFTAIAEVGPIYFDYLEHVLGAARAVGGR
ncbi:MAG: VapC toxin family PIN domain ribonuclease, partial [Spirochaetia bacterium]